MSKERKPEKKKSVNKKKYIFFDIDGVLNNISTREEGPYQVTGIEMSKVQYLKQIVDATGAKLVLISDWRLSFCPNDHMPKMADYITAQLAKAGLSFKLVSTSDRYEKRGTEIREYIAKNPCDGYLILDDWEYEEYFEPDLFPHYISICNKDGLLEQHIEEAIRKLELSCDVRENQAGHGI